MQNINVFNVKYVKESGVRYEIGDAKLNSPKAVYNIMTTVFHCDEMAEEYLYVFCVDTKGKITDVSEVSHGTVNASLVSPREIYKRAIVANASNIIIAHNHPSGDTTPSKDDIATTKRLKQAGDLLGIPINDHVIVGNYYYSFKENELIL